MFFIYYFYLVYLKSFKNKQTKNIKILHTGKMNNGFKDNSVYIFILYNRIIIFLFILLLLFIDVYGWSAPLRKHLLYPER